MVRLGEIEFPDFLPKHEFSDLQTVKNQRRIAGREKQVGPMRWSLDRAFRRYRRFALPLMAALLFFDVWASWHLEQPTLGSNVWLAGLLFVWVLLDALDRDDA